MEEKLNTKLKNTVKVFSKMAAWLRNISPVLFAVLVSFLVLWNQYNSHVTLTALDMNILFFVLFSISLVSTVGAHTNKRKCIWLIGISVAIIEVYFYNRMDNGGESIWMTLISFRSGFHYVWSKLLLLMLLYLLIVSIRVIRWSQEDWEKIQESNREQRRQQKEAFWKICRERRNVRYENYKKKIALKQEQEAFFEEERKRERNAEAEMRERRREANKEELEINLRHKRRLQEVRLGVQQKNEEEQENAEMSEADKKAEADRLQEEKRRHEQGKREKKKRCIAAVAVIIILVIYITLPIMESGERSAAWSWLDKVQQFVQELNGKGTVQDTAELDFRDMVSNIIQEAFSETQEDLRVGNIVKQAPQRAETDKSILQYAENKASFASVLAQYTIFFIALVGMLYVGATLLCRLAMQCVEGIFSKENKSGLSDFFNEYSTPVSVLIVATSMLSTFAGTSAWTFDKLPELFRNMAGIVLCIILILITVDAVRLILKQCVEKGSLLRTSMHIVFALLIDCVMGIVVGVLAELNIRGLLSSVFAFFLQGNRTEIYDKAESTLDEALDGEIKMIRRERKALQETCEPEQWEKGKQRQRYNKRQSAFSRFHNKNQGRRS